jgi:peptidoglycan glycosyltransferase
MKSKLMIIAIFGLWSLLIMAALLRYTLSFDPFFGTARNVVNRYQVRGEIMDRYGKILAYGSPRKYPLGAAGSPVIGGVNTETGSEGYIEQKYAGQLTASKISKLWYLLNQSKEGYPLKTTLDRNLLLTAYKAMDSYNGSVVIMRLDGEVLVPISKPSYDPNKMTKKYYAEMTKSPDSPLFNRAFYGKYEPGSTWKTVIALTLLEKNSQGRAITCNGSIKVGRKEIRCMSHHGLVRNMNDAFTKSCNIWFIENALSELKPEELRESFKKFMGREMKKDLGREDIALAAIGQGEVLVSPLELASLAASIGSKGMKPVPHLVKAKTEASRVMNEKVAERLSDMMTMVVKRGTARGLSLYLERGFVAAKTGTAERDTPKGKINTAVLIGLAGRTKNKPEIAFSVVIEDAHGYGGTVCVPVMKKILDYYFSTRPKQ